MAKTTKEQGREQQTGRSLATSAAGMPTVRHARFPLGRLRSEFDRLFEDFFRGWPAFDERESTWGFDIDDQAEKIVVRAEAPGFEPGDFDVHVRDNDLVLCACQKEEKTGDGARRWHRHDFYQSVSLPSGIDAEHINAEYRNGVLTVTVPKTEASKARRIEVKT